MPENPDSTPPESPTPADSVLDHVAARTGRSPRVSLRDAGTGDGGPLIDPKAQALQDELSKEDQGKYRILGEIARGGMGTILRGHDLELGREVALKVVDAKLAQRAEVVERFVEEAQIGGQLQHPGIVPVYELGLMADDRPYFTMKLIKGRTLAAMLARRKSADEDRVRFLDIFESICQTMAYAHSKGVIHRDLKPANIMVGAFGEVQVVDWGLSKVLRAGGVADELRARDTAMSVIETIRSGPGSSTDSIVGNVLGTPAYMSPEQAQGEIDKLDERTDVFALGAILCEILTGACPYPGDDTAKVVQRAALAELDEAKQRIEASNAAVELKRLCLLCLMPSRAARPRDAEEVARTVREHLSGLEERAHQERLNAERSRRQTQLAVFGALLVLLLLGGGGGGWWWVDTQRRAREAELARALDDVRTDVVRRERAGDYEGAVEAAMSGLLLVESGDAGTELVERAHELVATSEERLAEEQALAAAAAREREILDFLVEKPIRHSLPGDATPREEINAAYREALREFGIDLDSPDLADVLARYRDTPLGIEIARGFDGWARVLRIQALREGKEIGGVADEEIFELELLTGIGLDLDPNPARATIRTALLALDPAPILGLAQSPGLTDEAPETLALLAAALYWLGEGPESLRMVTLATDLHPTYFDLRALAGDLFYVTDSPDAFSAVMHLEAAVAMRPEIGGLHYRLSEARSSTGDAVGAVSAARMALRLLPDYPFRYRGLGVDSSRAGLRSESLDYFRRFLDLCEPGTPEWEDARDLLYLGQALAGEIDREDYLSWTKTLSSGVRFLRVGLMFSIFHGENEDVEPERVLELMEPVLAEFPDDVDFLLSVGTAFAFLGDERGLRAGRRLAEIADQQRWYRCLGQLIQAATHGALGEVDAARHMLNQAEHVRDELYGGRAEDWRGGPLDRAFANLVPLVSGR